jgi:hypothetical protein
MDERIIVASRLKMARLVVVSGIFVAVGLWMLHVPAPTAAIVGWASIVFFGAGFFVLAAQVVRPSRVILRADEFTIDIFPHKPRRILWRDIDAFLVWQPARTKVVSYRYVAGKGPQTRLARINRSFGYDGSLPTGLPMQAEALLALLNEYKSCAR